MPTNAPHFEQIRSWLNEIHREKQAAAKSAKAYGEFGSHGTETTHPIKDVDDGLQKSTTGARASENEKDIKEMEPAGNVNETKENPGPKQDDLNYNIGVHQAATGEAPEVEDDYKDRPKDPGTSSKMDTSVGPKYSSWVSKEAAELSNLANEILADIATSAGIPTSKPTQPIQPTKTAADTSTATPNTTTNTTAAQAGYELAAYLGFNKEAADQAVEGVVAETIKQAQLGADRVGAYIVSFMKESERLSKKAADPTDGATSEGPEEKGPPVEGAGGEGGGPAAALAAAAGDAGGPGPGEGAPMPPPDGGAGGPPGAEGAGGGGHDQALQELAMALMELGISPEELAQAMQGAGGGMGGGDMSGGMGGPPGAPMPAGPGGPGGPSGPPGGAPMPPPEMGAKIASAVKGFMRSGKFEVRPAKTAAERTQRNEMKKYVMEILGSTYR